MSGKERGREGELSNMIVTEILTTVLLQCHTLVLP